MVGSGLQQRCATGGGECSFTHFHDVIALRDGDGERRGDFSPEVGLTQRCEGGECAGERVHDVMEVSTGDLERRLLR